MRRERHFDRQTIVRELVVNQYYYATFRAAAFPGRRERSLCLFLVAWEGHQADKKAK